MENNNKYTICGNIAILKMKGDQECLISVESLEKIRPYTWCVEGTGYAMSRTFGRAVKMHRLVVNAGKGDYVDHIDGNRLNNTLSNLRICSKKQNEYNSKIRADNSSGFKGVSFDKRKDKYRAYINKDGHQYHLGYFWSAEDREGGDRVHAYGRYRNVFLSSAELTELQTELPSLWEQYIERLSEYMESSGKGYKNHAATIRRWANADKKKEEPPARNRDYSVEEGETI